DDRIGTYEVDCFLTANGELVTIHEASSPSIDHLWSQVLHQSELARGTVDELAARLADIMTRRLVTVLDAFDGRIDELVNLALAADPGLVAELTAVRSDLATVRRAVHPQRETLDLLRSSPSPLLSDAGRRRFSDVFDVAARAAHGIDAARTSLAETLDAYRGAEARNATEMTRVLTVYAAVVLPLSFIAGFFGMNFENLPWTGSDAGWIFASVVMAVVGIVSLGVFVAVGWIRRPSGRSAGTVLGRGLIEAARTPVEVAGALYEISTLPLRSVVRRRGDEPRV
ncbi:MAG: hypothetical protein GWN79_04615, partial [Actinobacteria bacterium]|nr:hypothetical protein [Actinomycetota bacterium]NIS29896.1 hypothetical protein [Actinomycetota bacterium]NIT94753.1 hypothetical protein [Actinomycetota bacterium]NIU18411.1 hypothetical protein [Actinomycetota bacterium]NIU65178.1 hypothetical protein [Actinomycetota bacterium]